MMLIWSICFKTFLNLIQPILMNGGMESPLTRPSTLTSQFFKIDFVKIDVSVFNLMKNENVNNVIHAHFLKKIAFRTMNASSVSSDPAAMRLDVSWYWLMKDFKAELSPENIPNVWSKSLATKLATWKTEKAKNGTTAKQYLFGQASHIKAL